MNRLSILSLIVATNMAVSRGLPTGCSEDVHCPAGSYCELTQLYCRECLRCEDLKRQPPLTLSCITSTRDCGECFAGLVLDDGENHCISPQLKKDSHNLLPYEWTIVSIALLLAAVICIAAIFVLRNFYTFKICTSTQTLVRSSVAVDSNEFPTAPLPPPSYNAVAAFPTNQYEVSQPLILPHKPQSVRPRHSLESQTARVFNLPAHVQTFSDDEIPSDERDSLPTIVEHSIERVRGGVGSSGNADVSEEATTVNVQPMALASLSKHLRDVQETNNNTEEDNVSTASKSYSATRGAGGGTAFIINVIRNVNTVQQRNELAL